MDRVMVVSHSFQETFFVKSFLENFQGNFHSLNATQFVPKKILKTVTATDRLNIKVVLQQVFDSIQ